MSLRLKSLLKAEGEKLTTQLKSLELNFNLSLLEELEENKLKKSNIDLITQKLTTYGISLPLEYSSDEDEMDTNKTPAPPFDNRRVLDYLFPVRQPKETKRKLKLDLILFYRQCIGYSHFGQC